MQVMANQKGKSQALQKQENNQTPTNKNGKNSASQYKLNSINPPQNIKSLLFDRFKQKKDKLMQSSSTYIDSGEIKKKKTKPSQQTSLLELIKQTSLQKFPHIQKTKRKSSPQSYLSLTINYERPVNESNFSKLKDFKKSYNTIDIQPSQTQNTLKSHLNFKRSSLDLIPVKENKFNSAQNFPKQIENNSTNNQTLRNFQLENELKKKYLKSIVDRYFPTDQNQEGNKFYHKVSQNIQNLHRKKSKLSNANISLPSINSIVEDKKQRKQEKGIKNQQKYEKTPKKESFLENQQSKIHQIDQILFKPNSSGLALSQSYILQQISEDEQFQQNKPSINDFYQNAAFYDRSGLFNTLSSSSLLLNDSKQDLYESINSSKLQKAYQNQTKQKRLKVYQNSSFVIFKVRIYKYQKLSQSNDLKVVSYQTEFRKYFKSQGALQLKNREFKARQMIENTKNNPTGFLWEEDMFDSNCIKINLSKFSTFLSQSPNSLSKLLYKIMPNRSDSLGTNALIQPISSLSKHKMSYFNQHNLLKNYHYNLLKFIKNICQQLQPLSLSLINNKLSLNNIFMIQDDRYAINQWGYSFFKQQYLIQTKKFQKRLEPILKNQAGQWFVTPEYLAPQILQNLCYSKIEVVKYWKKIQGKKMQKAIVNQNDLFLFGNKADVWSLGLAVLQIITLIPMWIGQKCTVQNKTSPKISPRKGFLHSQDRNLLKILTKQSYLRQNLNKILRIQSQPYIIEDWLKNLLFKMIELDPKTRISFQEIIKILNQEQVRIKGKIKFVNK